MFQKTLSRLQSHGGARTGFGILDYRAKEFIAALSRRDQAIASSPEHEPAHYYFGLTLERLGNKAASKLELAKAAQLPKKQQDKVRRLKAIPLTVWPDLKVKTYCCCRLKALNVAEEPAEP
jgi:hypothetical protein